MGADPVTMMTIAAVASGGAQVYQGVQDRKHYKAMARQEEMAAAATRLQNLRKLNATLGTQLNLFAARGVSMSGSALTLQRRTLEYGLTSANQAYEMSMQGARLKRARGQDAFVGGLLRGIGQTAGGMNSAKK